MTRRLYIAGHRGLVGAALVRRFSERGDTKLVHPEQHVELRDAAATKAAITSVRPDALVLVAGRVGGIAANLADPVGFLQDNLEIQLSVMRAAHAAGVERLLFIASANAFPADAEQPITERSLGTGAIDPETEPYGLSKLVGIRQCDAHRAQHGVRWHSVLPSNLYGPGDRFDPATAHVVAANLLRFAAATESGAEAVSVWGSGRQRRQLLYVDDLARACEILLDDEDPPSVANAAPLGDTSIAVVAETAARVVGFEGRIEFDRTRPEGVMRRELDPSLLHSRGWSAQVALEDGMRRTWHWYQQRRETSSLQGAAT